MPCPIDSRNSELLVAHAAGQLDPETARALESHLDACPACRALAVQQAAVWQALDAWQAPPVSPDFDQRLFARVRAAEPVSWWERLWRPQALPLAAAACVLLIAGFVLERPGTIGPVQPGPETVRVDQVERTLDDLELLDQFGMANPVEPVRSNTM